MPWHPLPRIAFAVATYPFHAESPADLPLEIGDELYIIEETPDGNWLRGYLVAPPSLLAGLTSVEGQTLEARVFSGIFPRSCVEVRELLGETDDVDNYETDTACDDALNNGPTNENALTYGEIPKQQQRRASRKSSQRIALKELPNGTTGKLSVPVKRDPTAPRPAAPVPMLKIGDETPTSASEPLIDEISSCLREWHSKNLHQLLLSRQYGKLDKLSQLITSLNLARQQFLYNVLTAHEYDRLREQTVWNLVQVNKLCGGEVIVRDPAERGRILTGDDSVVALTELQSVMSLLDEPPQPPPEFSSLHHLLVEIKGFGGSSVEETSLVVYLVSKPHNAKATNLSESFSLVISAGRTIGALAQAESTKTLFTDLSNQDIGDAPATDSELFLVVKVLASQQVVSAKPMSRAGTASDSFYNKDHTRSLPSSGNKSSRRSFMWGSKSTRSTFSRGSPFGKMDSVNEGNDERPYTNRTESGDELGPPSTAGSRNGPAPEEIHTAQKTIGIGVLKLNALMKQDEEVEQLVNIWAPTSKGVDIRAAGDDWNPIVRELMGRPNEGFEKSRNGDRLQVSLKAFPHSDADQLIRATPTMLAGVSKTNRIGFSGAPTKHRSDIYLTLNSGALTKQSLLSRYGGSATSMPSSLQGANLQVTLEVRRPNGERFENCIYSSSNTEGLTTFKSVAVDRNEGWLQTVRLALSPEQVSEAHVVMFLSDIPNMPFAVAHMPLWHRGAFIRDGAHGLLLYKIDENTATAQAGPTGRGGYLSAPWTTKGRDGSAEVTGPLALLRAETYLCSTVFSQDRTILGLLQWKNLSKEDLSTVLRQLMFVPEIEVVKLLSNILDSLFAVMVEHAGNDEYEDLVFTVLVRVLSIVHDRRFNLVPLVDQYAVKRFNFPYATSCLIQALTRLLENPTEPSTARQLRETLKIIRHIFKFITQARAQQKAKEADLGITTSPQGFGRQLRSIFKALDGMMRNPAPVLVGSQTLAVQHFHTWLPELAGLLSTEEILHIAIDFMDSCTNVKGKLILYKLVLIINYSKLEIFAHYPEQMQALSANTVRWISPHWGHTTEVNDQWRSQVRLCCSILASQMEHLGPEIPDHVPRAIDSYLAVLSSPEKPRNTLSLLFPTAYPFPTKVVSEKHATDEALVELCAIISALSNSAAGMQLELAEDDLTIMLENLLRVQMSILTGDAFPEGWLSAHIYHHKSTMRILQYLAGIMSESFLPDPDDAEDFNTELWKLFFGALLKLVGSPSLALETFPEQKRRAVWKIAGDVREDGAALLRQTWEAIGWETAQEDQARYGLAKIGGYQVQYVPALVGPIVELCMSIHGGLRRMAVEVLQTMIVSEWTLSEDLSVIQTEMIDCLDNYFKSKPLTESVLQKLFIGELLERFEPLSLTPDEPLYAAVQDLVGTLDEFLDLLVAVHGGEDDSGATDIVNRLRLMEFLRDMQKEEIFVRYVHQLADLQAESRNHAEAGLALRLHADLYEWDPTRQTVALPEPAFPAQTHFERKEKIYFDMIKHFEEGESWSNALTAYKELQAQYETNIYDFAKLARTERAIASIYESISKSEKVVPKYFKVIYKGLGFPTALRDKHFIFEGAPAERGSAFTDRMQEQYPSAKIVGSEDIDEVEGQFLVISAISAHKDLTHSVYQRTRVPQVIRDFLLSAHPQNFVVTAKRNTTGPVQGHHSKKLVFTTAEPFPTIMRRSEIVDVQELDLDAYETALERIVRKTQELSALERRVLEDHDANLQPLVDAIAASVEPNSESSVARYRDLLPKPKEATEDEDEDEDEEDEEDEPTLEPRESAIKMALVDHAMVIKSCLTRLKPEAGRQQSLQQQFEYSFEPEIVVLTPPQPARDIISTPSTTWRGSPSTEQSPKWTNIASPISSSKGEEALVRQVSVHQPKGTRLSFLPGRKKSQDQHIEGNPPNGVAETTSSHRRSLSKDKPRGNHFWSPSVDEGRNNNNNTLQRTGSTAGYTIPEKGPQHEVIPVEKEPGMMKRGGSVRKRLSMLKLGIKGGNKANGMGSLDEE